MPVFVHLTPERNLASIRRRGIAPDRGVSRSRSVYALPVTRSFQVSHQWLRELRRRGSGMIFGVYFRLPDDHPVRVGHYNRGLVDMTAAEAVALLMAAEQRDAVRSRAADQDSKAVRDGRELPSSPEGYEVVVAGAIPPSQILRIKALPQVVGWRYRPGAHGTPPCACICCERGSVGIGRLLRRVEEDEAAGRRPKATLFGRPESSFRRVERLRRERAAGKPGD